MSDFGVKMTVKNLFFDRAMVVREIGKINAAALSKAGAFVRRRARSSMRRRKKASTPGSPPSAHSTDTVATLKNILFAYDRQRQSVVIGPVRLNGSGGSVPALHEFGGTQTVRRFRRQNGRNQLIPKLAHYPPRPFMGPALKAEAHNFPNLWASNSRAAA
jgi:hypothetical protein